VGTDDLRQAFTITRGVLAGVAPDQLDAPTPCASWDVRALINHIVGASHWFAATMQAGAAAEIPVSDYTSGDVLAAYADGERATCAAFAEPGALERTITLPFGAFPGAMYLGLATSDTFVHGWDLAKSTGQRSDLDDGLAGRLLLLAEQQIPASFRGPDGQAPFGPPVDVAASAPTADRLAAFLGRTP